MSHHVGGPVILHGLSKISMNLRVGRVEGWDATTGRAAVRVHGYPKLLAVKPANFRDAGERVSRLNADTTADLYATLDDDMRAAVLEATVASGDEGCAVLSRCARAYRGFAALIRDADANVWRLCCAAMDCEHFKVKHRSWRGHLVHERYPHTLDTLNDALLRAVFKCSTADIVDGLIRDGADINHMRKYSNEYILQNDCVPGKAMVPGSPDVLVTIDRFTCYLSREIFYGMSGNTFGLTPLAVASAFNNVAVVRSLLEKGATVLMCGLLASVIYDSPDVLQELLAQREMQSPMLWVHHDYFGAGVTLHPGDPRSGEYFGPDLCGPLDAAVKHSRVAAMRSLLECGPPFVNQNIFTYILDNSIDHRNLDLVRVLLAFRARFGWSFESSNGGTPLEASVSAQSSDTPAISYEIVQLLLDDPAMAHAHGDNALVYALEQAAQDGQLEIVRQILDRGVDVDSSLPDEEGRTALKAAVGHVRVEVVELLMERGANAHLNGQDGDSPLSKALGGRFSGDKVKQQNILRLLQGKAPINQK
jgi:ankyrin repeat protein